MLAQPPYIMKGVLDRESLGGTVLKHKTFTMLIQIRGTYSVTSVAPEIIECLCSSNLYEVKVP